MAYHHDKLDRIDWCACTRCGRPIKVIEQGCVFPSLAIHGAEQRGFQCIICGRITCFECSDNRYRCPCGGNAWVARVYENESLLPPTVQQ